LTAIFWLYHQGKERGRVNRTFTVVAAVLAAATAQEAPPAHAAAPGVHAHLLWNDVSSAEVNRELDELAAIGAEYVRVDVGWSSLEPERRGQISTWYRDKLDHLVTAANQRGLKLILTFWETPCWASSAPDSLKQDCTGSWWDRGVQRYAPRDPGEYARALAMVVERYGSRVAAWEVWNEPNHPDFLLGGNQLDDYAQLLKAAYPAAKAADRGPRVLGGALADSDFEFTDALLRRGVGGHFDGWAIHPYSADNSPLDPGEDKYLKHSFIRGIPAVRRVLLEHDAAAPLWLTEFGWSTCNVRDRPEDHKNCVGEARQATYLELAYRQMAEWAYVPVGVWYNTQDTTSDPSDKSRNFGLKRFDGSRKPAHSSFRAIATGRDSGAAGSPTGPPKLTLDASRRSRGIRAQGRSAADVVLVRAYRYRQARDRYASKPRRRVKVATGAGGAYSRVMVGRQLRHGRWKVVASTKVRGDSVKRRDVVRWRR
jgi:hypothetical protein